MGRPTSDGTGFPDGNRRFRHAAYIFGKDDGIRHLIDLIDRAHEVKTAEFVLGNGGTDRESARGSHGVKPFAQPVTVLRQAGRLLRPNPSANLVSRNRRVTFPFYFHFEKRQLSHIIQIHASRGGREHVGCHGYHGHSGPYSRIRRIHFVDRPYRSSQRTTPLSSKALRCQS